MVRELAQEVRNFIEQTNEWFERAKISNKVLLEAIQKLSSNNNNERLSSQREHHSTHEENEP